MPKRTADIFRLPMRFNLGRDELFLGRNELFVSEGGFQFLAKVAASSDGRV